MNEARFLSLEHVIKAGGADMGGAIADVTQGFELLNNGKVTQPHKVALSPTGLPTKGFNLLPAIVEIGDRSIFGCKILGANPNNVARGLPRATGLITLYDGESNTPLAVMDAQVISATRTGAVSGLAARHLVQPDTESVGLVGAGVNMRTQLLGVNHELPQLREVTVYSPNGSKYDFADTMSNRTGLDITPAQDAQSVIEGNKFNILCTTKPRRPLIEAEWLPSDGMTIFNISGVATPPEALPSMDRLVTDSWTDCATRSTQTLPKAVELELVQESRIEELGTILKTQNGRRTPQEDIFFCPVGLAFEDVMVAWRVYNTAIKEGIGQKVDLWVNPKWI